MFLPTYSTSLYSIFTSSLDLIQKLVENLEMQTRVTKTQGHKTALKFPSLEALSCGQKACL